MLLVLTRKSNDHVMTFFTIFNQENEIISTKTKQAKVVVTAKCYKQVKKIIWMKERISHLWDYIVKRTFSGKIGIKIPLYLP